MEGAPLCKHCAREGALRAFHIPKKPGNTASAPAAQPRQAEKKEPDAPKPPAPVKRPIDLFAQPYEEAAVEAFCARRNIACTVACRWIFLRTPAAHWRIEHDGYKALTVYHENLNPSKRSEGKSKMHTGFHRQTVYSKDIFEIIAYIHCHDQRFLRSKRAPSRVMRA